MFHFTFHAVPGTWLFESWAEGLVLWEVLHQRVPGASHAVLMPDHGHLLHRRDVSAELGTARRAMARIRNRRRGERGPVFSSAGPGEWLPRDKRFRVARYVPLNPCRAGLVADPLAWPLSTHRDRCGLNLRPVVARASDAGEEHRRVSADHACKADGTDLPEPPEWVRLADIGPAVCSVLRVPSGELLRRGAARSLALRTALATTDLPRVAIAEHFGVALRTVQRHPDEVDPGVRAVVRVIGDRRFSALDDRDLTRTTSWQRYWGSHIERRMRRLALDRRARRR